MQTAAQQYIYPVPRQTHIPSQVVQLCSRTCVQLRPPVGDKALHVTPAWEAVLVAQINLQSGHGGDIQIQGLACYDNAAISDRRLNAKAYVDSSSRPAPGAAGVGSGKGPLIRAAALILNML